MQYLTTLLLALCLFTTGCQAQPADDPAPDATERAGGAYDQPVPDPDPEDLRLFEEVMDAARAERLHERPIGEIMVAVGEQFEGMPYAAGMLDEPAEEQLICTLNAFDCVTFVETALAMARVIQAQDYSYDAFARHVRDTRYRDGEMDGYCSRMHYFTEWIADNEARGSVRNVTREAGGVRFDKQIDFMTKHRSSYPRLVAADSLFACIREMEAGLAGMELYYIPQDRISRAYDRLQAGDIIATATDIRGLDVTHTGLVYANPDGTKGFLHASTSGGVKVSPDLQRYVQNVDRQIGIIVARPLERRGH